MQPGIDHKDVAKLDLMDLSHLLSVLTIWAKIDFAWNAQPTMSYADRVCRIKVLWSTLELVFDH